MSAETTPPSRVPALFVSHGAAFFTTSPEDRTHRLLKGLATTVSGWRPRGVVVVSAHFAAHPLRVTGPGALETIHDHPAQGVYDYRYPGRGSPELTRRTAEVLSAAGLETRVEAGRGLDHGAWVPLSLLLPGGETPVLQLSLDARGRPDDHVAIGRALAPLREEGVLLVGSGGVTHNQDVFRRGFFGGRDVSAPEGFSRDFDSWATGVLTGMVGDERDRALAAFRTHPLARLAHPTIEHFLPLLVIAAAAGADAGEKLFEAFQHSLSTSAFRFG